MTKVAANKERIKVNVTLSLIILIYRLYSWNLDQTLIRGLLTTLWNFYEQLSFMKSCLVGP